MPPEHPNSGPTTSALIEYPSYPSSRAQNPPSSVQAITSLVHAFAQLVFTPLALNEHFLVVAVRIYRDLIAIVRHAKCPRARLCALSFLLRLRADRDHRLYFEAEAYERDVHTRSLASHIGRADPPPSQMHLLTDPPPLRPPQDRESRAYRGRGATQTRTRQSRSRSRAPRHLSPSVPEIPVRNASWRLPEYLPFDLSTVRNFSERLTSYDPEGPGRKVVLPLSEYVALISELLQGETDWEVLSYVLCFLPVQLSNKHLFCGPKCREEINRLLNALCKAMKEGFAAQVEHWSPGATPSHANGLAYHTLLVLVGYRRLFKSLQQNVMVELFYLGLSEQPFTARCCLHALSLAAFELRPSMTRYLANILEKLAQIISNPILPVHIINFLAIIGSTPSLHANFTPGNFKQVFVVALRYLQDHNRQGMSPTTSWALSQHVRIMSYAVIYLWFLAVKLPERPQYVSDIVKGLLEANEGNAEVDEPTEVCLDWLARYTYASADPRPAKSILDEVVMEAKDHTSAEVREKTWVMGDSAVITIRALTKLGWVEVLSRRPSGLTKILCRVENIPLVGPGDVDPDMVSLPGVLMMDKDPHSINSDILSEVVNSEVCHQQLCFQLSFLLNYLHRRLMTMIRHRHARTP
jgi:tuberous sclerosis 2